MPLQTTAMTTILRHVRPRLCPFGIWAQAARPQRAFNASPPKRLRCRELRDDVVAERCPHRGFQRSRPDPPSSAQLRWHIGQKSSNKLIEIGSWVWPPSRAQLSNPSHPYRPAWPESQHPSSAFRQPSLPLSPGGQQPNPRLVRRPSQPWRGR